MKSFTYKLTALMFVLFLTVNIAIKAQGTVDPASINVYKSSVPIVVDGNLTEASWAMPAPDLKFRIGGAPSGLSNFPTGVVLVKGPYRDTSTCFVRFLRDGQKLYVSLNSNDKSVCTFGDSWEGDGLFMKIKKADNTDVEYKLYYNLQGVNPEMHYEGPTHSAGVGVKGPGTITNDSASVDGGYTGELMINLDSLGYTSSVTSVQVLFNIFDPDDYTNGQVPWGANGNFSKQYWGSEWGPVMRTLNLLNVVTPVEMVSFTANVVGSSVQLNWATATEANNKGFDIERSANGSVYASIGFIAGNGTSTSINNYTFVDNNIQVGVSYSYRLKQVDFSGVASYSSIVQVAGIAPTQFAIEQNYPNPFNPSTSISFSLPVKSNVNVSVFNLIGELVSTIAKGEFAAGVQKVDFNASTLTSGVYIYRINATGENGMNFSASRKMILMK